VEFLYGDSTTSPLTTDFVDFLRRGFDCFVAVLQAEQRMVRGAIRRRELELHADQNIARLRELEVTVSRALATLVGKASPDAPVTRCSEVVSQGASTAVGAAEAEVKRDLASEVQRIEETAAMEGQRCVKAWEQLLLVHPLPGMDEEVKLELRGEPPAGRYTASVVGQTPYGVTVALELEIASGSAFAAPLRVASLVETLEIQVPKMAGWIRKEGRLVAEKLGRFVVVSCSFGASTGRVSLRSEALDEGYDFVAGGEGKRLAAFRVPPGATAPAEFELGESEATAVQAFLDKLATAARELPRTRKALAAITFEGEPVEKHRRPSLLVQRLIDAITPTVREIAARSGSERELVLRRRVGDGRREEHFVRRADLLEKLAPLPAVQRALFTPLALGPVPGAPVEELLEEISTGAIVEELRAST
jgi:hypothetical protein